MTNNNNNNITHAKTQKGLTRIVITIFLAIIRGYLKIGYNYDKEKGDITGTAKYKATHNNGTIHVTLKLKLNYKKPNLTGEFELDVIEHPSKPREKTNGTASGGVQDGIIGGTFTSGDGSKTGKFSIPISGL